MVLEFLYEAAWIAAGGGAALFGWRRAMRGLERASRADWGARWLVRLDGLNRLFCRHWHRLRHDPVALPEQGAAIVAANHVSGLDPLLLIAACDRPLRFMIAAEEYQRPLLNRLFRAMGCIPVDRGGRAEAALSGARQALRAGEVVAIFPEGGIRGDNHDGPLKRGVVLLSARTGAPIIPLRVEGIRGRGMTLGALLPRSRARLRVAPPITSTRADPQASLAALGEFIGGRTGTPGAR